MVKGYRGSDHSDWGTKLIPAFLIILTFIYIFAPLASAETVEELVKKGITLGKLGRHEEAIAAYDEAIKIDPNFIQAWENKCNCLNNLGRYNEAIVVCDEAILINVNSGYAWFDRGYALLKLDRNEEAIAAYDEVIKIDPTNSHAWNNRGVSLQELDRNEEAIASYDEAIKIDPNFKLALNNKKRLEKRHRLVDLIIVAVVIGIILIAVGKGGKSTKSQPPAKSPKPKTVPTKQEPTSKPTPTKLKPDINITSAFSYKGATIIHKIKVENPTSEAVSDIKLHLFVPDVFLLNEHDKNIGLLKPHESKTVTFEIRPTGECGNCEVSGRVTYYDYKSGKTKEVDIPAKTLSIVCPLLKAMKIDKAGWKDTIRHLIQAEESTKEIQIPAETLFSITSRMIGDMQMYMLEPEINSTPQLFNGVARFYAEGVKELKYAAQIEVLGGAKKSKLILKVWAEKEEALTGFYHGMLDEIEKRVHVKGYIENSIVQQFYHIGDKIGTIVKDVVAVRSTIGAGKRCPSCGRDVPEDERFCSGCGTELQ